MPLAGANEFVTFEGIDLEALPPETRSAFVKHVNAERCPCGCPGDTVARRYVNDPGCAVARARLRALWEQMREAGAPQPWPLPRTRLSLPGFDAGCYTRRFAGRTRSARDPTKPGRGRP